MRGLSTEQLEDIVFVTDLAVRGINVFSERASRLIELGRQAGDELRLRRTPAQ